MKNSFTFLFISFFIVQIVSAQVIVEKLINGQVTVNNITPLEGINVTNTSSKIMVVSDQYGHFSIQVKVGDILSFSAINFEPFRKYINKQEFNIGNINIDLSPKSFELDEVIINENHNISAENLGIIPRDQIKLTTAERRLATASSQSSNPMGLDPLLNKISGRTKMLKKELSVEKKEVLLKKLEYLFEDEYYIGKLKIPEDFIKGFQYYCIEDVDFARSLKEKNKTMSMFLIVGLATEFNKNQKNENSNH